MNVKQAAERARLSVHTVRYYTNQGLVPTLRRAENGAREFDEMDINWLLCVSFLRESGMSIAEIRRYVSLCVAGENSLQERYEMLLKLQRKADKELERAKFRAACIHDRTAHCQNALLGKEKDDSNPVNWLGSAPPTFP